MSKTHRVVTMVAVLGSVLTAAPVQAQENRGSEQSDHARMVGRPALSWFGVSEIAVGDGGTVLAPALGVRYWVSEELGIDAGLGVSVASTSGSRTSQEMETNIEGPTTFGLLFHLGVPLALFHDKHYAFLIIPEANFGLAEIDLDSDEDSEFPSSSTQSGIRFDIGARAGAEIHFGFIGIPQLSLEASIGVFLQYVETSNKDSATFPGPSPTTQVSEVTNSSVRFSTTVTNDPWDIFRTSVAARYYF